MAVLALVLRAVLCVLEVCEADDELRWEPVTRGASDEIVERFPS